MKSFAYGYFPYNLNPSSKPLQRMYSAAQKRGVRKFTRSGFSGPLYLQKSPDTYLHVRQLVIGQKISFLRPHRNVEPIPVSVSHNHIASIGYINTVREEDDPRIITANSLSQITIPVENTNCVAKKVANVELLTDDKNIRRFLHDIFQAKPLHNQTFLSHYNARRWQIFNGNDLQNFVTWAVAASLSTSQRLLF